MNDIYFSFLSYFQMQNKEYKIQGTENKIVKYTETITKCTIQNTKCETKKKRKRLLETKNIRVLHIFPVYRRLLIIKR